MEYFNLNVFNKTEGAVFIGRNVTTNSLSAWPFLCISNKPYCQTRTSSNICKGARFTRACLNDSGEKLLAGDRFGNIFVFDLTKNKFWLINKVKCCCTALSFTALPERDILIASSDCILHIFQSVQKRYIAQLVGHKACINHIATNGKGHIALTSSLRETIVWDLLELSPLHYLPNPFEADLIKSVFADPDETIVSFFRNDVVLSWDFKSQKYIKQYESVKSINKLGVGAADVSSDGQLLAVGGKANWIVLWDAVKLNTPHVFSVASGIKTTVRQLQFVALTLTGDAVDHILAVVSHEGSLYLYSVATGQQLLEIKLELEQILSVHAGKLSRRLVVLTCNGQLKLYNLDLNVGSKGKSSSQKTTSLSNVKDIPVLMFTKNEPKAQLSSLTVERLKGLVKEQGHFPEKYRFCIWSNLLKLPNNDSAFNELLNKGTHESYKNLGDIYPVGNAILFRVLFKVLCLLTYWCPRLGDIQFLPALVFPFVKLLHFNTQQCFEILVAFISIWGQNWFSYYPNPPFNILSAAEEVLSYHDTELLLHFIRQGVTAQVYVWLLLRSIFTEVFTKEKWVQLFDHIVSNEPDFLLYLVVSFNINIRKRLLKCKSLSMFESLYQKQMDINIDEVIKKAYLIRNSSPANLKLKIKSAIGEKKLPFQGSAYPTFDNFPSLVNFQKENKLMLEEIDYVKKRQEVLLQGQLTELRTVTSNTNARSYKGNGATNRTEKNNQKSSQIKSDWSPKLQTTESRKDKEKCQSNVSQSSRESSDVIRSVLRTRYQLASLKYENTI